MCIKQLVNNINSLQQLSRRKSLICLGRFLMLLHQDLACTKRDDFKAPSGIGTASVSIAGHGRAFGLLRSAYENVVGL
jgi:hypothetical protein